MHATLVRDKDNGRRFTARREGTCKFELVAAFGAQNGYPRAASALNRN